MEVIEASNKEQYNQFILDNAGSLEQSWQWGELMQAEGCEVKRYLAMEQGRPQAAASFIKYNFPLKKYYWLCPRGPVIASGSKAIPWLERLLRPLRQAQGPRNDKNFIFVRIEPELLDSNKLPAIHPPKFPQKFQAGKSFKLAKAPKDHSPRATILIDLEKSEEELLQDMHQKTRYNVRLSSRKGVRVEISNPSPAKTSSGSLGGQESQISKFLDLLRRTAKRDKFHLHTDDHYRKLLDMPEVDLFLAFYKEKAVAGALVSFFGQRAVYMHGASDYDSRQLMAPYFLHWEIIKSAKNRGMKTYDLWGVSPKDEPNHPWAGVSRFKKGFGGKYVEHVGSWDYVISPFWYKLYKLGRKLL